MRRSVLLVEDNELLCEGAAEGLEALGLEVHVAHDGAEAIGLLRKRCFDAALVDFDLPRGVDGVQVARRAKRLQPSIRVILTSGYEMTGRDLPDGIAFLPKPYSLPQIIAALSTRSLTSESRHSAET